MGSSLYLQYVHMIETVSDNDLGTEEEGAEIKCNLRPAA